jgi:hypothetical protein
MRAGRPNLCNRLEVYAQGSSWEVHRAGPCPRATARQHQEPGAAGTAAPGSGGRRAPHLLYADSAGKAWSTSVVNARPFRTPSCRTSTGSAACSQGSAGPPTSRRSMGGRWSAAPHAAPQRVNHARHLVPRHARVSDRHVALGGDYVAVADAARLDLDADGAGTGLGNIAPNSSGAFGRETSTTRIFAMISSSSWWTSDTRVGEPGGSRNVCVLSATGYCSYL